MQYMHGLEGDTCLVNGVVNPRLYIAPGQVQRWRICNASTARFYRLALASHTMYVVGTEGEATAGLNGPGPIGAPQKKAAKQGEVRPTSGAGHGVVFQSDLPETSRSSRLGKITQICTPVGVNGEPVPDPRLHLVCYELLEKHDPRRPVATTNRFGKSKMVVRESQELCVPSTKELLEQK